MTQQNIETVGSKADRPKLIAAILIAVAGAVGFQLLSSQPMAVRLLSPLAGVVVALLLAWSTETGKRIVAFGEESVAEAKKVVWPTRKESTQMTGIVFGFVLIMAIYLFAVDKTLEWLVYDVLMGMKF
jgi:preprotein translocase subunit SecE